MVDMPLVGVFLSRPNASYPTKPGYETVRAPPAPRQDRDLICEDKLFAMVLTKAACLN